MPLLPTPSFNPPLLFRSSHLQTIYPTLFRPTPQLAPQRERLELDDGDFLDIDWHTSKKPNTHLAIISHGLEGNSRKKNVLGMARQLIRSGFDVICHNFRGCSGQPNRLPRLYHSGVTDDLHRVVIHGLQKKAYSSAVVVGFSMGGNQTLKYLGENSTILPKQLKAAVVFSVPCMLADSVTEMDRIHNRIYMAHFMKGLKQKVRIKARMFPELFNLDGLSQMKTFAPFDDKFTGPLHGFKDAADYYARCSSRQFLPNINLPTLLVQAKDDPFLSTSCYPVAEAEKNDNLFLEIPQFGGHVGFLESFWHNSYWHEKRASQFLRRVLLEEQIAPLIQESSPCIQ